MGFNNTQYNQTIQSLTKAQIERTSNPYWKWISQKPTIVRYWNVNNKMSTLDLGKKDTYDQVGAKSSLRYNRIDNFVLYGITRFNVDLNLEEYGVESSEISGEALILPNTIIPSVDDYFTINYISKPYLFRVTKQTIDNIETDAGVNFYKISWELDSTRQDFIDSLNGRQLVNKYVYNASRVGSNMTPLLTEEENKIVNDLDKIYDRLRSFYINLFWRENIQTFVYGYTDGMFIYDPYLIEFLIRNELFDSDEELKYLYIDQAVHKSEFFDIEYESTIFRDFETVNPKLHINSAYALPVHDPNSLLVDRMEEYHELSINKINSILPPINQLNMNLFDHIVDNSLFDETDTSNHKLYWNIFVNYLNNPSAFTLTEAQLTSLSKMNIKYSKDLFYEIPLLMFMIKGYLTGMIGGGEVSSTDSGSTTGEYLEKCYNVGK